MEVVLSLSIAKLLHVANHRMDLYVVSPLVPEEKVELAKSRSSLGFLEMGKEGKGGGLLLPVFSCLFSHTRSDT